jgi:hypothetical protein
MTAARRRREPLPAAPDPRLASYDDALEPMWFKLLFAAMILVIFAVLAFALVDSWT